MPIINMLLSVILQCNKKAVTYKCGSFFEVMIPAETTDTDHCMGGYAGYMLLCSNLSAW